VKAPHPVHELADLLPNSAERAPGRGLTLLDRRGRKPERKSWPELQAAVEDRAGRLASLGLEPGGTIAMALDTSFELVETWLAALRLGARPVALAPGGPMGATAAQLERMQGVVERLEASLVVGPQKLREDAQAEGVELLAESLVTELEVGATRPRTRLPKRRVDPEAAAFFQLTSGSTGHPRAVAISHRAALHNLAAIEAALDRTSASSMRAEDRPVVSWLPLHHDMGLVGCLLATLRAGLELVLMPPRAFLGRPMLWLEELARSGASVSSAPNFGYQACLEDPEARFEGRLEGWRAALVGAEMVRPETLGAFAARFAPAGFDPRALRPCYGMAEATLAVSFDLSGEGLRTRRPPGAPRGAPPVACLGRPVADTEIAIQAPDGQALGPEQTGEVVVRGPGLFMGYHGEPEATAQVLREGWLHTGDLGFLAEGELYLTGRRKELLILRGQNLMPHELEWCAEAELGAGGTQRAGAFSIDAGAQGEVAVLAVEVAESEPARLAALERAVRVRIGRELGLVLADLVFVRRGRLPKTTSGKVQRGELRRRYLARELERIGAPELEEP
jgi:fatty-acyl-CoA synthase